MLKSDPAAAPRLRRDSAAEARARLAIWRFAWRDLRGGLRFYGVFIACLVLGVMAITGVAATSRALREGLAQQGAVILGGDLSLGRAQGPLDSAQRQFLAARGAVSETIVLRAMAQRPEAGDSGRPGAALVEIKAVDAAYPLFGAVKIEPQQPLAQGLARQGEAFGLLADQALGARLGLKLGDRLAIGDAAFVVTGWLVAEPDSIGGISFGPRVMTSAAGLAATGLMTPGALARYSARVKLNPGPTPAAVVRDFSAAFADAGFEARTSDQPSPQLSRNIEHFAQFLTLIGLTSLVCGGVGVGNSVRGLIDRKRRSLAILKALGASGANAGNFVLAQVMLVAAGSALLGAVLGLALPLVLVHSLGASLPFPLHPRVNLLDGVSGAVFGLLTAFAFAAAPLELARRLPATVLLRDSAMQDFGPSAWRGRLIAGFGAAVLFVYALLQSGDRMLTAQFGAAILVSFAVLYAVAQGVMALARRIRPHLPLGPRALALRLAVGNLYRPGALTPSFLISLGLGVTLLTALTGVERNLRAEISQSLPAETPSFFFLDIQSGQAADFRAFLQAQAPEGAISTAPMLRGRIVRINDVPAEQAKATESARWALEGDRGITFDAAIPAGSRLIAGEWWPGDYKGPPLVSLESGIAEGLGLKIGDTISVNVLGRVVTARIANLRKVNWRSFGINFVLDFSPNTFAGAPFTQLMTLGFTQKFDAARDGALLREAARRFPSVASVSVRETLDTLDGVLRKLSTAIIGASALAFIVSALVLSGALAAGQRARIYDAVVLKTLGATRGKLLGALALEFSLLGLATAAFGLLAGGAAAWFVTTRIMDAPFVFSLGQALALAAGVVAFAIFIGLIGTWRVLGEKPAGYLRQD